MQVCIMFWENMKYTILASKITLLGFFILKNVENSVRVKEHVRSQL